MSKHLKRLVKLDTSQNVDHLIPNKRKLLFKFKKSGQEYYFEAFNFL